MGLISTLVNLTKAKLDTQGDAPGKSAIADAEGFDGQTLTTEVFHGPGIFALPGDGTQGIWVPVGGNPGYGVVVAVHNYQVEIDVNGQGGFCIYATTADGKTVKAKIILQADGTITGSNDNGNFELSSNGKFSANGNLEVDP